MDDFSNITILRGKKGHFDLEMTYKIITKLGELSYNEEDDIRYFLQHSEQHLVNSLSKSLYDDFCERYYQDKKPPLHTFKPIKFKVYTWLIPLCEQWVKEMKVLMEKQQIEIEDQIKGQKS